jgi:Ca-activated chloride channel family protein
MHNFEFEYPYVFTLLLLIVCIYKCPQSIKELIFPHTALFDKKTSLINRDKLLYSLIFTLLVTALASPMSYDQKSSSKRKGRDLVFVLDTSGSMAESGFSQEQSQKKKFDLLKELLNAFILKRHDDNVGVAIFGSYAYAAIPLTYDMGSVKFLLDFFDVGIAGDSTAIGEGLASGLRILQKGEAKEKVIILITDGFQNSGTISVKEAVLRAKKMGVKVYTIGLGEKNSFDAKLLLLIAENTKGKMFSAQNAQMLREVYSTIDTLEPSQIRSQHYLNKQLLYVYPLAVAAILLSFLLLKYKEELA